MATQAQVKAFIKKIAPIAQAKAVGRGNWSLPSVCIAQACCESAYGTSTKMLKANALFGIKVGKSKAHFGQAWKDKAYSTVTKECYDGRTYVNITDMFRAYGCIEDAVEDYYDMLASCRRYRGCLNQQDPRACITAIKNGGYATDPNYITTVMSIIKANNLTQYDSAVTKAGAAAVEPIPGSIASAGSKFTAGKNYTLQANMYVRKSAGGAKKKFLDLTANAKANAIKQADGSAVLKKGTVVTCKETKRIGKAVWMKIPSGYVCAVGDSGAVYIK